MNKYNDTASKTKTGEPGPPGRSGYRGHKGVKWHYGERGEENIAFDGLVGFSWSLLAIGIPSNIDSSNIAPPALSEMFLIQNKILFEVISHHDIFYILSTAVPAVPVASSSCKELYEKHK